MKFFDNINDYNDYFCVELSCRGYLYARPIYIHQYWKGAGYYWLDSRNKISYSVVDTRLENVPFSTVPKCEVCNALGENCPACSELI